MATEVFNGDRMKTSEKVTDKASMERLECLCEDSREVTEGKGKNIIPEAEKEPLWKAYLEKFKDPIIIILMVALALSLGVSVYEMAYAGRDASCLIEPVGVLVAILLATGIGFIFEVKAENEFKILNKAKDERPVKVLRWRTTADKNEGRFPQTFEIPKSDVCAGDIVVLENGDEIPADGLLTDDRNLIVDESNFTGEPFAKKRTEVKDAPGTANESTYPENFLLRGSTVIEGSAKYRVTAVGQETEEGKGARILQEEPDVKTPLNNQLDQLAKWITYASYVIAALIVVGRMTVFFLTNEAGTYAFLDVFRVALGSLMIAVTLIVVAVPEGLPMSVTISLALSMRKMLKEKNLVRKLHACETLGAATVICTDKTGTLTKNKMSVVEAEFWGVGKELAADSIAVNTTAALGDPESGDPHPIGNPTEGALLLWLHSQGIDYQERRNAYRILAQEAFSTERKRMSTEAVNIATGDEYTFLKGAPELLLETCDTIEGGRSKESVLKTLTDWQSKGMRTLGFAFRNMSADVPVTVFSGIVGIADPIRGDVREAIDVCSGQAGVRVIMVTGDNPVTALEIARQSGIIKDSATETPETGASTNSATNPLTITGQEFAAKSDEYLKKEVIPNLRVLSRARPEDKVRLVTLLQEMGEVVAVTGDGTNDAPALKKAQVGLSMGDGTARAKEASDVTIIDNSFSSINKGILWGRSLYLNIKRFILFQMTINVCACLIVLLGAFIGLDSPLTVTQMLWVNLIMDTFAAMALSSIPPDPKVMKDKPRDRRSHIIDRKMGKRIFFSGIFFFVYLALLWQLLWQMDISSVRDLLHLDVIGKFFSGAFAAHAKAHLSGYELGVFFTTFVLIQFWNLFNARYFKTDGSLMQDILDFFFNRRRFKASACYGCVLVAGVILVGQFIIVNCFGAFFEVAPLSLSDWGWILLCTSPVLVLPDLFRFVRSRLIK